MHDIVQILVTGLLTLIIIHRDHLSTLTPLFPWLHGTAANEHFFGVVRQLIADFTFLDFIFAVIKVSILVEAEFHSAADPSSTDNSSRARASGYHHTYMTAGDDGYASLAVFPSDEEIRSRIAPAAFEESCSLWTQLLGVDIAGLARDIHAESLGSKGSNRCTNDVASDDELEDTSGDDESQNEDDALSGSNYEAPDVLTEHETAILTQMLNDSNLEGFGMLYRTEQQVRALEVASVGILVEESLRRHDELAAIEPVQDINQVKAGIARVAILQSLRDLFNDSAPASHMGVDVSILDIEGNDYTTLVDARQVHQTREAKYGVKARGSEGVSVDVTSTGSTDQNSKDSVKRLMMRELHRVVEETNARGASTGLARQMRWEGSVARGVPPLAGNSENAAFKANADRKGLLQRRSVTFRSIKCHDLIETAGINLMNGQKIVVGSYAVVLSSYGIPGRKSTAQIRLGKVLTIYSKNAGKGSNHAFIESAEDVATPSYIVVELYDCFDGSNRFCPVVTRSSTRAFEQIKAHSFLYLLTDAPTPILRSSLKHINLSVGDFKAYNAIRKEGGAIFLAVKKLGARRKKGVESVNSDAEDTGGR